MKNRFFSKFSSIFKANLQKNRLITNIFLDLVTRRAGRLSWTRRVIRCQGKSSRKGLATNRDLLRWNLNFWLSSIRSNFDFILFSGSSRWIVWSEILTFRIYRPFEGWNCGLRISKFFEKSEKNEKSFFFEIFISFKSKFANKSINYK